MIYMIKSGGEIYELIRKGGPVLGSKVLQVG